MSTLDDWPGRKSAGEFWGGSSVLTFTTGDPAQAPAEDANSVAAFDTSLAQISRPGASLSRRRLLAQHGGHFVRSNRFAKMIALDLVAMVILQERQLGVGLYSLSNNFHIKLLAK